MGVLQTEPRSEYFALQRKEAARIALEEKLAREADPEFDRELWELEQAEQAEEERQRNPLEFFGYSPLERRVDDMHDAIRLQTYLMRQFMAGKNADQLPPFKPAQRPGVPIKSADDVMDIDDLDEEFGAPE